MQISILSKYLLTCRLSEKCFRLTTAQSKHVLWRALETWNIFERWFLLGRLASAAFCWNDTLQYKHKIFFALLMHVKLSSLMLSIVFLWVNNFLKCSSCHHEISTLYNILNGHLEIASNCLQLFSWQAMAILDQRLPFSDTMQV